MEPLLVLSMQYVRVSKMTLNSSVKKKHYTLTYKGKTIYYDHPIRNEICVFCKRRGRTYLHHRAYDDDNPLAFTVELCFRCHARFDKRFRYGIAYNKKYGLDGYFLY